MEEELKKIKKIRTSACCVALRGEVFRDVPKGKGLARDRCLSGEVLPSSAGNLRELAVCRFLLNPVRKQLI